MSELYLAYASWMPAEPGSSPERLLGCLDAAERAEYGGFKVPKRRDEWLLGRWAAKSLVSAVPGLQGSAPQGIHVLRRPGGQPYITLGGSQEQVGNLSLSHSHQAVLAGFIQESDRLFGVDLEWIEPRDPAFLADYFTPREQDVLGKAPDPARSITLFWSAKEALLKALGVGLGLDTRTIEVERRDADPVQQGWKLCLARVQAGKTWQVLWRERDGFIQTVCLPRGDVPRICEIELPAVDPPDRGV